MSMNHTARLFILAALLMLTACASGSAPDTSAVREAPARADAFDPGRFELGKGDQITLSLFRQEDFDGAYTLDSNGQIHVPLVGTVDAAGKSPEELRSELQERFADYLVNPQVTLEVTKVVSRRAHVLGEVQTPGTQSFRFEYFFWEALTNAGGFTNDADRDSVLLLRKDGEDVYRPYRISLDLTAATDEGFATQNFMVEPGDIVYVLPSTIASVERFANRISNIIRPIVDIERGIVLWPQVQDAISGDLDTGGSSVIVSP